MDVVEIPFKDGMYAFPAMEGSDAKDEGTRVEENEFFQAPGALENVRMGMPREVRLVCTWQKWLMHSLVHVAKHYRVDRHRVLKFWVKRYGVYLAWQELDSQS